MSKTYLLAGASSRIATETGTLLRQEGYNTIGLSTRPEIQGYDACYTVDKYAAGSMPELDTPIDGLVYFPGTINLKPFHRLTEQDFIRDFEVNTLGAAAFIQQYLGNLRKAESASIVLMSSVAAGKGMPFHASVSMAKAAVEGLTRSLAAELAPGIRVNAVAPSLTDTPLAARFLNTAEKTDAAQKRNPLRKIGTATEVANAITFLLSSHSSWITGQIIAVDGGMINLN